MRFFQMIASSAALIAAALAVEINQYPTGGVVAGQTYTVTYSPADNTPTTFILRKGVSTDLGTIGTLTSMFCSYLVAKHMLTNIIATATGGTFSWTVDSTLADGDDYALEIEQTGASPNYSGLFGLTGGSAAVSSASASATASMSASAASASSASAYSVYSVSSVIASRGSSASSAASASASLSSMMSSVVTSVYATATGTGAMISTQNGTISTPTLSGSASLPESTGAASSLSSAPLALLLGAVGAFALLN